MNWETRNPKSEIRNPEVDELLHSFFRSEMPQPWPASFARSKIEDQGLRARTDEPTDRSSILNPRRSFRSRWVLAASVAILLIGSWWLGQRFAAIEPSISPTSSGKMIGSKLPPGKNKPPHHSLKNVLP